MNKGNKESRDDLEISTEQVIEYNTFGEDVTLKVQFIKDQQHCWCLPWLWYYGVKDHHRHGQHRHR